MIVTNDFTPLIGKTVRRVLIVIWPPSGEAKMLDVDISIALEIDATEECVFHIRIDKADGWTPIITKANFDGIRPWAGFYQRIDDWMSGRIDSPFQHEVFEAAHDSVFENIVSKEILDVECVTPKSEFNPFAIKVIFSGDYIVVSPTSRGTTVETAVFNKLENLKNYEIFGDLEYISVINHKV